METPFSGSMSVDELSKMRRELLRILKEIEPQEPQPAPTGHESVCHRIQRLCRDGIIPEHVGDFMHVVRKCRNRAEYQDYIPEGMEAYAIRSAWAAIEDWRLRRTGRIV